MSLDQAIAILEKHQECCRRDNSVPLKTQMQNPKAIGEALDIAIHLMKGLNVKNAKPFKPKNVSIDTDYTEL